MKYVREKKLIIWRPVGLIDPQVVLDYYQNLKQCSWGYQANRFCDFSLVERFELDYSGLSKLRDYRMIYLADHSHIKLVMYSHAPLGYAMSRMYQTLLDDTEIDILVTRDLAEAANFVRVELETLST